MEKIIELVKESTDCCDDTCCGDETATSDEVSADVVRETVRKAYAEIAVTAQQGCGCGCGTEVNLAPDKYNSEDGYVAEADLGLGCGMPTDFVDLKEGEHVLDLGSGGGLDAFIARSTVGETGRVVGIDMTDEMIELATANAEKLGYSNVEFVKSQIEEMAVENESFDVVLSNCVLNLVPEKEKAFSEIRRVLKAGGRFSISDIVFTGNLDESLKKSQLLLVGCVAGAVSMDDYLAMLFETGFADIQVRSIKPLDLSQFTVEGETEEAVSNFTAAGGNVYSITVTGYRK